MSPRRISLAGIGTLALALTAVSLAWACVPAGGLTLSPTNGPAGASVTAGGTGFPNGQVVKVYWGAVGGPVLATTQGPTFSEPITIPGGATPGCHTIVAATTDAHADHSQAPASFRVTEGGTPTSCAQPSQPPPPPSSTPPPGSGQQTTTPRPGPGPTSGWAALPGGKTITGTSGVDTLVGTPYADVINCGAGNDRVRGGAGNDVINCGGGNDRVSGGAGNDRIGGGRGNDRLSGGSGDDRISGGRGNDRLAGNGGLDRLFGNAGRDLLFRQGQDRLSGGPGRDSIF